MNIRSEIKLHGSELQLGETIREVCPVCSGGSQREKSLVITRGDDGVVRYICHRASCATRGSSEVQSSTSVLHSPEKKKTRKVYTGEVQPLTDLQKDKIKSLWGITDPPFWYNAPKTGGRIAMSVRSPKYMHRGWVLRDIWGTQNVKALTYLDKDEESLSWYRAHSDAQTLLVEDIPSAVKASTYVNAVALLGTGIGLTKADEIARYATRPIVVALDQDATGLSFDHVMRYAALWDSPEIIMLDKDIKDMKENDIERLF